MECGNSWTSRSSGRRGYITSKPQEKYPLYFIMYTAGIDSLLLFLRHWSNSVLASELGTRGCWEVVQKIGWKALSQRSWRKWNRQTSQVEAIRGVGFVVPSFFHTSKQHFSVLFLKSKALSLLCPCSKLSHPVSSDLLQNSWFHQAALVRTCEKLSTFTHWSIDLLSYHWSSHPKSLWVRHWRRVRSEMYNSERQQHNMFSCKTASWTAKAYLHEAIHTCPKCPQNTIESSNIEK